MAGQKYSPRSEEEIELPFPYDGIDETMRFTSQRKGSTIDAQNVRAVDDATGRQRGCSRPGLLPYFSGQAVTTLQPGGATSEIQNPIQCIDQFNTSDLGVPATYGRFVFAHAVDGGFGIATGSTGVAVHTAIQAASGFRFANSCWDSTGNLYVAQVNTTTGAVKVHKVDSSGVTLWTNTTLTCATGTNRNVPGIVVINDFVFVALTKITTPYTYTGAIKHAVIAKLKAGDGSIWGLEWRTTAAGYAMYFSTAALNCLGAIGNFLIVDSATTTPLVFWTLATGAGSDNPLQATGLVNFTGETLSHNRTRIVSDGVAFYMIANTSTAQIKRINLNQSIDWASTECDPCNDLGYDHSVPILVAVATAANRLRKINLSTGALTTSVSGSATTWDCIDFDWRGTGVLLDSSVASNDSYGITASTMGQLWAPATLANADHRGCSMNKGQDPNFTPVGAAAVRLIVVAGGEARKFTTTGTVALTSGARFSTLAPQIFSAQNGANLFFADGAGYYYLKGTNDTITTWTATAGSLPLDSPIERPGRLIVTHRGRTYITGFPNANWFASRRDDAFDWDYAPATTTQDDPTNSALSSAGIPGDGGPINCVAAYNDDVMIWGLDRAIYLLAGDPMSGGQFDRVTDQIGMVFGRPFAKDTNGQLFFMSTMGSIFKMTPGVVPVRVSQKIDKRLANVNLDETVIRMAWDVARRGLWVWITPIAQGEETTNFFFDERTESWWADVYFKDGHQPFAVHILDMDRAEDRIVFVGGRDGRVRYISESAPDDDGYPINSYVIIGPLSTKLLDDVQLCTLRAMLSADSGSVGYEVYVGRTVEEAMASDPVVGGTWSASLNLVHPVWRSGFAIFVKLIGVSPWAIEMLKATYKVMGPTRRKW